MSDTQTLLDAALEYAEKKGWHVFPVHAPRGKGCSCGKADCDKQGKHPRIKDWQTKASIDARVINAWWAKWTDANIGVALKPSGLALIDMDVKNGQDGPSTWAALQAKHGFTDDGALEQETPSGGLHRIFDLGDVAAGSISDKEHFEGIDVKTKGYFIVEPSVTLVGAYVWEVSSHPSNKDPVTLPAVLASLLQNGTGKKKATVLPNEITVKRNNHLTSLAGSMRRRGAVEIEILAALQTVNASRCKPPLSTKEVEKIAESVASYEVGTQKKDRPPPLTSDEYHALCKEWELVVKLNSCNDDIEINGEILTDVSLADVRQRFRDYGIIHERPVNMGAVEDSLATLAAQNRHHPIKDYLGSLVWDGVDHLGALLAHFEGDGFLDRWLDTWLAGAVARVYRRWQNPMLVLVGAQNLGKSYLANWLCSGLPGHFIESPVIPDSKDHRLRLIQNFVWEVQELGSTTRKADQDALKGFLTLGEVTERKSYGRRDIRKPVVCSFIGTVNPDCGFLTDLTGNRRYLVTMLNKIDWGYSTAVNVNQIWAQAVHRYRAGDAWKLTAKERARSEERNELYMVVNPVQVYLEGWYSFTSKSDDFVSITEILSKLDVLAGIKTHTGTARQVASVLSAWGAKRTRKGSKRTRGYAGIAEQTK